MANNKSNNLNSTTITTRIDSVAKDILNRENTTYRQILEETAYSLINNKKEEAISYSQKDISHLEEDIQDIEFLINSNNKKLEQYKQELNNCEKINKHLSKMLSKKKESLSKLQDNQKTRNNLREKYSENIKYDVNLAAEDIEKVLKHNHDLRQKGPRARVKESEIKSICRKYKVNMSDVMPLIDQQYIRCMEGYEKYV